MKEVWLHLNHSTRVISVCVVDLLESYANLANDRVRLCFLQISPRLVLQHARMLTYERGCRVISCVGDRRVTSAWPKAKAAYSGCNLAHTGECCMCVKLFFSFRFEPTTTPCEEAGKESGRTLLRFKIPPASLHVQYVRSLT